MCEDESADQQKCSQSSASTGTQPVLASVQLHVRLAHRNSRPILFRLPAFASLPLPSARLAHDSNIPSLLC